MRKADPETLVQSSGDKCKALYASTDDDIYRAATSFQLSNNDRNQFLDAEKKKILATPEAERPCWETAFEHHGTYDLFYAEFDDQGDATDVAKGAAYEKSELHLIETALSEMLDRTDDPETGLNIVVFTHGWHGNPRADNSYSMEFKGILQDISRREEILKVKRQFKPASGKNESKPYRTVGIEIAWRGDSFDTYLNVWDRKLAAQTISNGAVQELFAFLNQFYRDHSCDSAEHGTALSPDTCGDVHMLAIGHSFGALITFRALVPRLESGINVGPCDHAYGFGDITILLNPAFEGERYRALFNDAVHRPLLKGDYYGDNGAPQKCESAGTSIRASPQIPTLVTLQSEADWATGNAFPIFLGLTTPFAQTLSDEEEYEKNHAIGWVPAFQTHTLAINSAVGAKDSCPQLPSGTKAFCPVRRHLCADRRGRHEKCECEESIASDHGAWGEQTVTAPRLPAAVVCGRQFGDHVRPRRFLEPAYRPADRFAVRGRVRAGGAAACVGAGNKPVPVLSTAVVDQDKATRLVVAAPLE